MLLGGENDDGSGDNLRGVLAALPAVLHRGFLPSENNQVQVHTGNLLGHLLAGHEQLYVQPDHLLLDECKVCINLVTLRFVSL